MVITVVSVGVNIVEEGQRNDKLAWIVTAKFPQAIPAECHSVELRGFTEIDLDPAIPAIADPACPWAIQAVIDMGSIVESIRKRHGIFCHGGPCRAISLKGQAIVIFVFTGQAQRRL
jgi:hypothetical protein